MYCCEFVRLPSTKQMRQKYGRYLTPTFMRAIFQGTRMLSLLN